MIAVLTGMGDQFSSHGEPHHCWTIIPSVKLGLWVGLGGVPDLASDVVVSMPTQTAGCVVPYDMGKRGSLDGFERTGTNLRRLELGPTKTRCNLDA